MKRNQRITVKDIMKPGIEAGALTWGDILVESSGEQIFALVIREQTHLINQLSRTPDRKCPVELRSCFFYYVSDNNRHVFMNIVGVYLFGYIATMAFDIKDLSDDLISRAYKKTALIMIGDSGKVERIIELGTQKDLYKDMYATKLVYKHYPWADRDYLILHRTYLKDMDIEDLWNVMGDDTKMYKFPISDMA